MKIKFDKEFVVNMAIKHFGEADAKVYEKMFAYMETITEQFNNTADLEVCTEFFVRFLNDVGHDYFYGFITRVHESSPLVRGITKKAAFENELKAAVDAMKVEKVLIAEEAQATISLYRARQAVAKAGLEELSAMVASTRQAREELESILHAIVRAGDESIAQMSKLIAEGDLEGARKVRTASKEAIEKLEADFAAQQEIVNAKAEAYKAKDAELRELLGRTIL